MKIAEPCMRIVLAYVSRSRYDRQSPSTAFNPFLPHPHSSGPPSRRLRRSPLLSDCWERSERLRRRPAHLESFAVVPGRTRSRTLSSPSCQQLLRWLVRCPAGPHQAHGFNAWPRWITSGRFSRKNRSALSIRSDVRLTLPAISRKHGQPLSTAEAYSRASSFHTPAPCSRVCRRS